MTDFVKARTIAEEVLRENYITKPPVPVMELAKNYGYDVIEVDLSSDIAGFVDPVKHTIYVNVLDSNTRKAFTVAHELGHIKLHASDLEQNPDIGILYRRPLGKKGTDQKEQEANCFAASLLVPQSMLGKVIEQYKDVAKENNIELLSALFGVSPEVMGYRLRDCQLEE